MLYTQNITKNPGDIYLTNTVIECRVGLSDIDSFSSFFYDLVAISVYDSEMRNIYRRMVIIKAVRSKFTEGTLVKILALISRYLLLSPI